nr:MAG TPA: hypothetical protein [Caudoviricetes sp.]
MWRRGWGKYNKHQSIQRILFILSYKVAKWWQSIITIRFL